MEDSTQLRNRAIVEEIVTTNDRLREEVSKQFTAWRNVDLDWAWSLFFISYA